jgi:succinoglycan biosynthesis transport protein ExoP
MPDRGVTGGPKSPGRRSKSGFWSLGASLGGYDRMVVPQTAREAPELRDYLRVLRRRRSTVLLTICIVVGVALAVSFIQTPEYAATAEVRLQRRSTETLFDPNTGQALDPKRALQTEIRVLKSKPVRAATKELLGFSADISATPAGETDIILVRAEAKTAKRAADIANAYATTYIDFRRKQSVDDVLAAATEVQAKITEMEKQIESAPDPLKETLVQQQALFKNKLDELQVNATLQSGGAQLVSGADTPATPFSPKPARNGALALVLGSFLAVGIAFLVEYMDDSVKTKDDLERAAPSLPVMSMIPAVSGWRVKDAPKLVSLTEPKSPAAEAYRTLRTSIQFLGVDRQVRVVQVTSPNAQEGKTTTLANLGVALARAGQRVVIICSDLRRPRVHEFFGLGNEVGFTSVLLGEISLEAALQPAPGIERLSVLASGPIPPNPSELLQSRRTAELLARIQAEGHFLLIDSPPVLPVSDALVLSKRVDGTLLVCSSGSTGRKELSRAVEMLRQVDAPIIGTVLNGVTGQTSYGYAYQYASYEEAGGHGTNGNGSGSKPTGRRRRNRAVT